MQRERDTVAERRDEELVEREEVEGETDEEDLRVVLNRFGLEEEWLSDSEEEEEKSQDEDPDDTLSEDSFDNEDERVWAESLRFTGIERGRGSGRGRGTTMKRGGRGGKGSEEEGEGWESGRGEREGMRERKQNKGGCRGRNNSSLPSL